MARSRKRSTPSFEVPADVTSGSQSGWVFRSDGEDKKKRTRQARAAAAPLPADTGKLGKPGKARKRGPATTPTAAAPRRADARARKPRTRKAPSSGVRRRSKAQPSERPALAAGTRSPMARDRMRFVWLPFAMVCSTVLALLPSSNRTSASSGLPARARPDTPTDRTR